MCERPWGISTNFTWRDQRGLDDWSSFADANVVHSWQSQKMESCMERKFEIIFFFLSQRWFVMTKRTWLSCLPASSLLHLCQEKPDYLTSLPSIRCVHNKCSTNYQGVGTLPINENNKTVSSFTIFLRTSLIWTKQISTH